SNLRAARASGRAFPTEQVDFRVLGITGAQKNLAHQAKCYRLRKHFHFERQESRKEMNSTFEISSRLSRVLCTGAVTVAMMARIAFAAGEPEWRFVVVGDSPGDPASATGVSPYLATVAQAIANERPAPDFVLFPGDLISDINETGTAPPLAQQYQNWLAAMAPLYDAGI